MRSHVEIGSEEAHRIEYDNMVHKFTTDFQKTFDALIEIAIIKNSNKTEIIWVPLDESCKK